ncbi:MAG TPA: 3'(2'),5'-bisphosphate nucleotidase CysQ [Bacteroidales bacterium]|nr:3'(2'),5'-bisphosphate nucleotidase CysQ [Bacteroidales bacterium]
MKQITPETFEQLILTAISAGKAIMEVYATNFDVEIKPDHTPLTLADTRANDIIQQCLVQTGIPVISEEGRSIPWHIRETWDQFWLVDPLDGTKEFVHRNGEFSVNIALVNKGVPILGVIYAPVTDTLYWADNQGAFRLDHAAGEAEANAHLPALRRQAKKLPLPRTDSDFTIVASRSHLTSETMSYINLMKREHHNIRIVSRGSSLKMCMVAEGQADVYPRFGQTSEWDTAAGHAIILAAGGKVVLADNPAKTLTYNKSDLQNPSFLAFPFSEETTQ